MKRALLIAAAVTAFLLGYGVVAAAWPYQERYPNHGYFTNDTDYEGTNVWQPNTGPLDTPYGDCRGANLAIPTATNTKSEFIKFVKCKLNYGNAQERVGAKFIIQSMRGGDDHNSPSSGDIADWETRVNNPDISMDWGADNDFHGFTINSYYQGTRGGPNPVDDAFFEDHDSSDYVIRFMYKGSAKYMIRRACANPIGELPGLPDNPQFSTTGHTTVNNSTSNISVAPGDQVTFRHYVKNNGPEGTSPIPIYWIAQNMPSQATTGGPANSGTYTNGQEKLVFTEPAITVPANAAPGTQYCRRVGWDPTNSVGGSDGRGITRCATVVANYNLVPDVNANATEAEVGDTITFTYTVANTGTTDSVPARCTVRDASGATVTGLTLNCSVSHVFPAGTAPIDPPDSPVGTENYVVPPGAVGSTICRQLRIAPATPTTASADSALRCVTIVAKPYMRVYGGDVSVGNGLESGTGACPGNPNGAVVGWNRGNVGVSASNYGGAGAQYAVMALNRIQWFSAALGNTGGAPEPRGLSFAANTTSDTSTGFYGGLFGSLPCIPDYYGDRPASTLPLGASVGAMVSGVYGGTGPAVLGGGSIVGTNNRLTIYVEGDVFISSNITYAGSWTIANMPLFRLVVHGNIIIDSGVTQLDGLYVAQRNGATGGIIYSCGSGATRAPIPTTSPAFYTSCDTKLTINGALIAHQLQLGRTIGTVSLGLNGETGATGNAAEVFNYSPIMWIPQPIGEDDAGYDAITSLPPVL